MKTNELVRQMNACLLEINENGLIIRQYARVKAELESVKKIASAHEKKLYQIISDTNKVSAKLKENSRELNSKTRSEKIAIRELKAKRIELLDERTKLTQDWNAEYRQMKQATNRLTHLYLDLKEMNCTPEFIKSYVKAIDHYNDCLEKLNAELETSLAPLPRSVYRSVNQRFPFKLTIERLNENQQ